RVGGAGAGTRWGPRRGAAAAGGVAGLQGLERVRQPVVHPGSGGLAGRVAGWFGRHGPGADAGTHPGA
ncbi:hypothetical protein DWU95_29665, partial [Burkholderia contaminans]